MNRLGLSVLAVAAVACSSATHQTTSAYYAPFDPAEVLWAEGTGTAAVEISNPRGYQDVLITPVCAQSTQWFHASTRGSQFSTPPVIPPMDARVVALQRRVVFQDATGNSHLGGLPAGDYYVTYTHSASADAGEVQPGNEHWTSIFHGVKAHLESGTTVKVSLKGIPGY
jgi:hypothetical protein